MSEPLFCFMPLFSDLRDILHSIYLPEPLQYSELPHLFGSCMSLPGDGRGHSCHQQLGTKTSLNAAALLQIQRLTVFYSVQRGEYDWKRNRHLVVSCANLQNLQ